MLKKLNKKKLLFAVTSFLILSSAVYLGWLLLVRYAYTTRFCEAPTRYAVAEIDPRFNLDKKRAVSIARSAGDIWNKGIGDERFVFDEANPTTKIYFIYDDRQKASSEDNAEAQARLDQRQAEAIDDLVTTNKKSEEYVEKFDSFVDTNTDGEIKEISFGVYEIYIYVYKNDTQLLSLLVHELGHSKGVLHAKDGVSIMSAGGVSGDQILPSKSDIELVGKCGY